MSKPIKKADIPKMFESLKQQQFFGKLTVEFNRGEPKLIRIEETKIVEGENPNESQFQADHH